MKNLTNGITNSKTANNLKKKSPRRSSQIKAEFSNDSFIEKVNKTIFIYFVFINKRRCKSIDFSRKCEDLINIIVLGFESFNFFDNALDASKTNYIDLMEFSFVLDWEITTFLLED
jgi:hypothetical protein